MEGESNNIKNVDNGNVDTILILSGTTSRRKKTILIGVIFSFAVGIALVVGLVVGLDNTPTSGNVDHRCETHAGKNWHSVIAQRNSVIFF